GRGVTGRHHGAHHPCDQALALATPARWGTGTYLYDYHATKYLAADPMPVEQAESLTDMISKQQINVLAYVDDAKHNE
ncbi:pyridoxal phosphatase, partial [Klebsiella pneumoniae]|nr:pyridoxal phosphatase [Klebsiella pneumoniae]